MKKTILLFGIVFLPLLFGCTPNTDPNKAAEECNKILKKDKKYCQKCFEGKGSDLKNCGCCYGGSSNQVKKKDTSGAGSSGFISKTFKPDYKKYGSVEGSCVNPVQLVADGYELPKTLKWLKGGEIFKEAKAADYCQSCAPHSGVGDFTVASFGSNVTYCVGYDYCTPTCPSEDHTKCYFNKTEVGSKKVGEQEIFGENLYRKVFASSGGTSAISYVHDFNNGLDACGGPKKNCKCQLNRDGIVCVDRNPSNESKIQNIYWNGLALDRKFDGIIFSKSSPNFALLKTAPGERDSDMTLFAGNAKLPPMNLGANPKPLEPIDLGVKLNYINLGRVMFPQNVRIFGNHIVFERNTEDVRLSEKEGFEGDSGVSLHIIYDGVDLGPGGDPALFQDHLAFVSSYCGGSRWDNRCRQVLIYDNKVVDVVKDLGLDTTKMYALSELELFGDHIAFHLFYDGTIKVVYDGKIVGEAVGWAGKEGIRLFGDHIAFFNSDYHVVYDGKDLGNGDNDTRKMAEPVNLFADHVAFDSGEACKLAECTNFDGKIIESRFARKFIRNNVFDCESHYLQNLETSPFGQNKFFKLERFDKALIKNYKKV